MNNRKQPEQSIIVIMYVIYSMHLFSAIAGLMTSAYIVTAFLTGWPSIIALILSYAKRHDSEGTYLHSHFNWVIRTFWFALVGFIISCILIVTIIGIPLAFVFIVIIGVWVIYRMVRGIMCLLDEKPVCLPT